MNDNNNMQNNKKDDAIKFVNEINSQNSNPSIEFENKLKAEILNKNKNNSLFFNSFIVGKYKIISFVFVGILVFTALGGLSYLYLNEGINDKKATKSASLSLLEKNAILTKIASSNTRSAAKTEGLVMQNSNYSRNSLNNADMASGNLAMPIASEAGARQFIGPMNIERNYNYSHTIYTYESGKAFEECMGGSKDLGMNYSKTENFDYFDNSGNGNYASKMISTDKNGELTDYYLTTGDSNIQYKGGKYAVKFSYNSNIYKSYEMPVLEEGNVVDNTTTIEGSANLEMPDTSDNGTDGSSSESSSGSSDGNIGSGKVDPGTNDIVDIDPITMMFGQNPEVREVTEDGVKYYEIIWSDDYRCGQYLSVDKAVVQSNPKNPEGSGMKSIVRSLVDQNTYEIKREEVYIKAITPANLVSRYEINTDNQNVSFDKVKKNFEFEYSVEVKEVKYLDFNYQDYNKKMLEIIRKYLVNNPTKIIKPEATDSKLSYFDVNVAEKNNLSGYSFNFYSDRNFYPEGARGDEMYNLATQINDDYLIPDISYSYDDNNERYYSNLGVKIYMGDVEEVKILTSSGIDTKSKYTKQDIQIGNDKVSAKFYAGVGRGFAPASETTSSDGKSAPDVMVEDKDNALNTGSMLVFNYNNRVYVIDYYSGTYDANSKIKISAVPFVYGYYDTKVTGDVDALMKIVNLIFPDDISIMPTTEPKIENY